MGGQPALHRARGNASDESAWQAFLVKAVKRYGPGGGYWTNAYHAEYRGPRYAAADQAWQIWNEPNLNKFFNPGGTSQQSVQKMPAS